MVSVAVVVFSSYHPLRYEKLRDANADPYPISPAPVPTHEADNPSAATVYTALVPGAELQLTETGDAEARQAPSVRNSTTEESLTTRSIGRCHRLHKGWAFWAYLGPVVEGMRC